MHGVAGLFAACQLDCDGVPLIDREEELANEQRRLRSELASLRSPRALHALAPELGLSAPERM